jgi:hypothetical protein
MGEGQVRIYPDLAEAGPMGRGNSRPAVKFELMDNGPAEKSGVRIEVVATVIAAIFTVATFFVAVLAYLRPTDSAHPPHFDFLSRTLSFPMWVGAVMIFGAVATSAWSFRLGMKRATASPGLEPEKNLSEPPKPRIFPALKAKPTLPATSTERKAINHHASGETFTLEMPDHYAVRIYRQEIRDTKGLVIGIDNNRLDTLGKIIITIFSAQGFSERHGEFREPFGFQAARLVYQGNILASTSGLPLWIVRKEESKPYLLAADDQSHPMNWPDGDPVEIEKWRLKLEVTTQTVPATSGIAPKAFSTQPFNIIVSWNAATDEFFVDKDAVEASV